jgi:UDP-N-acetylmuramyl tripeptide synthase
VRLHDFLPAVDVLELTGDTRVEISELVHDSRRAGPDALFCCIPGAVTDGHDHAPDAVARVAGVDEKLGFTTPEATELQALLARMRDAEIGTVAMEVSSHALSYERVDGTTFAAVGFTNL